MNDVVILGAGPGGYELALEAAKAGLQVVLIEKSELGGTCLNAGCIPTKTYYRSADMVRQFQHASALGLPSTFSIDYPVMKQRKEQVVKNLKDGISFQLKKAGVQLVYGYGRLTGKNTVEVDGVLYEGKTLVIATGSSPIRIPGFEKAITSEEMLEATELPKKLVIIGGGVIGIEMACIYNSLGVEVEVVESMPRILPMCDEEISKRLLMFLRRQGIAFHLNARAVKHLDEGVEIQVQDEVKLIPSDACLVAVGRRPNVRDLGLENVGIEFDHKGIVVDNHFKTSVDNIYAIGDVTGRGMLAHTATYAGYHVLHQLLGKKDEINFNLVPSCVFSFPEVSWVGMREEDAKTLEIDYEVFKGQIQANGKAQTLNELDGMVKLILSDDRLIGGAVLGVDASVLIHELAIAIHQKMTKEQFVSVIHAHPTLSEIFPTILR